MDVVARIQGHPDRAHLHQPLLEALQPLSAEVRLHSSSPPNPWIGYHGCLADPPDCTHLLIVQDDVIPCHNFAAGVQRIAEAQPDVPVCLFLGALPGDTAARARRAMIRDHRYVQIFTASFIPLVAVLWPIGKAEEFLLWSFTYPRLTRADDANASRWARTTKQRWFACVPSLVEHNDEEPSVKGGRAHTPWTESWRRALFLADDALTYEWGEPVGGTVR